MLRQSYLETYNINCSGCLLVDVRLPGISGLELQKQLNEKHHTLPIIFMTGYADIDTAVQAMKQGAFDFLVKPFKEQILIETIQKAIAINSTCIYGENIAVYANRLKSFTQREREVMKKIIEGSSNKVIAKTLGISNKTVELHRGNIMKKMHVKSALDLVKIYLILDEPLK